MMKKIKGKISYDFKSDSVYAYVENIKYLESIDLNEVILDIGEDFLIKGIEILDVSKKFGLNKYDLKNIKKLIVKIKITEDIIVIEIHIKILKRNKEIEKSIIKKEINNFSLSSSNLCLVC